MIEFSGVMPTVNISTLYLLKEQLALASFQLSDYIDHDEDISFAKDNIEAALETIMDHIKTEEYDPSF